MIVYSVMVRKGGVKCETFLARGLYHHKTVYSIIRQAVIVYGIECAQEVNDIKAPRCQKHSGSRLVAKNTVDVKNDCMETF